MDWPIPVTGFSDADFRDMSWMGRTWSGQMSRRKDLRTRLGPAPVLKTLRVVIDLFRVIPTHMMTFQLFSLNMAITSVSSSSPYSALLMVAGKIVAAAGSGASRLTSNVALCGSRRLVTGKEAILGSSTFSYMRLVQSSHSGLLSDVSAGLQNQKHCSVYGTSDCSVGGDLRCP